MLIFPSTHQANVSISRDSSIFLCLWKEKGGSGGNKEKKRKKMKRQGLQPRTNIVIERKILLFRVLLSCQKHTFIINFNSHTTCEGKQEGGKFILTIVFLFNYAPYAPMNDDDKIWMSIAKRGKLFSRSLTFAFVLFHFNERQRNSEAQFQAMTMNRRKQSIFYIHSSKWVRERRT